MSRWFGWALLIFAAYFVLTHPDSAAADIKSVFGAVGNVANSLSTLAMKL